MRENDEKDRIMAVMGKNEQDLLLVIDIQNDFCPGGALAVPDGDAVVPVVNRLQAACSHVVLTQDWHPAGHHSFASAHQGKAPFEMTELAYGPQVLWPEHCVQGTHGAAFHQDLVTDKASMIIRKGYRAAIDSYSAFFENDQVTPTGLSGYVKDRGVRRVFLSGLATDFCVLYSALDAAKLGLEVKVIEDACRAIDLDGSLQAAWSAMAEAGIGRHLFIRDRIAGFTRTPPGRPARPEEPFQPLRHQSVRNSRGSSHIVRISGIPRSRRHHAGSRSCRQR